MKHPFLTTTGLCEGR